MMPIDLVLVRHGESEGNVAGMHSRSGNDEFYTEDFRKKPSSQWRLSDRGIEQARIAGDWIKRNCDAGFDRHYVSEYFRAVETAFYLAMPDAEWRLELYLREREWGELDTIPHRERLQRFAEVMERKERDSLFWRPPNGESIADLCLRVDRVLDTMHRECGDKRVLIVGHGEVMWTFRIRLERMSQQKFLSLERSEYPLDHLHNCQVLHYTRRDPKTGQLGPFLNWMRSVCPWDMRLSSNEWQYIERPLYATEDLKAVVDGVPRLVNA
jgi:broad specificity phosphatase PhoE